MVWMSMNTFPNFRKLWGRINDSLKPGEYKLKVNSKFDVKNILGKKSFILELNSIYGVNSLFCIFLLCGAIFLLLTLVLLILKGKDY